MGVGGIFGEIFEEDEYEGVTHLSVPLLVCSSTHPPIYPFIHYPPIHSSIHHPPIH